MTGNELLRGAIARLRAAGVEDPARDARLLIARALGIPPERLTLHLPDPVGDAAATALAPLLDARAARQPMAQILGRRLFMGHEFRVTPDTLDPRPETEVLVQSALERPFRRILDLGTGTGCILLSCLLAMPGATGLGTDLSPAALAIAEDNARRLGIGARARFAQGDWWQPVSGRFDVIVSNPPYIAEAELAALSPRCATGNRAPRFPRAATVWTPIAPSPRARAATWNRAAGFSLKSARRRRQRSRRSWPGRGFPACASCPISTGATGS